VSDALDLPGLPFPVTPSQPDVWRHDGDGTVVADAPGHTDLYVNPGGSGSADAESLLNAATLLGLPPTGDFQLSARVSVDFVAQFDAGVLLIWLDDTHWAKLCFEFSPAGEPMVVSVVTLGLSDDANSFVVPERSVWLRVSRLDRVYAYHASSDGKDWSLVRVFSLGDAVADHRVGLEVQSPTGEGCTVRFEAIRFVGERLADLRDGS
jgi:regulation of enolase protein 1 (concanavalin A-like superfamily)